MTVATERRIRFAHVDPAGIAYYPRLVEMVDGAVEDWSRQLMGAGRAETHLRDRRGLPCVALTMRFTAPCRLDEVLRLAVRVAAVGASSADLLVCATTDEAPRFEAELRVVLTDLDAMRAVPWPDGWREKLEAEAA